MTVREACIVRDRILDLENVPNEERIYYMNGTQRFVAVMLETHKNDKQYLDYVLQGIS